MRVDVADSYLEKRMFEPEPPPVEPHPQLPGALTYGSPESLILEASNVLMRVVRLAHSLNPEDRLSVLGDLLTFQTQRLDPLQQWVERHRAFLSDLSAKQARKRRRRQKRVRLTA